MATTKIWPIKDSLRRVTEYASNPEKTEYDDLKASIGYAVNGEKTGFGDEKVYLTTGIRCDADTAFEEMMAVKESFGKTGGNVAYHDSDDEEHDIVVHDGREEEDEQHNRHGSDEGCDEDGNKAGHIEYAHAKRAAKKQHHKCHSEPGSAIDTEDGGTGERILECRLQHESAHGKGCSAENGSQRLREARLENDEAPACLDGLIA